jgi:hypothetical protein
MVFVFLSAGAPSTALLRSAVPLPRCAGEEKDQVVASSRLSRSRISLPVLKNGTYF